MMRARESADPLDDFPAAAELALRDAASRCGFDARGARLIRLFASAVYHIPSDDAVARIGRLTSAPSLERLAISIRVARWLCETGFPAVEPLPVEQPVTSHGCAVTFWRYLPQDGPAPNVADLGVLLRWLHHLNQPPVSLPSFEPLVSVRRAIDESLAISEEQRSWLRDRCDQLLDDYSRLSFPLASGMIHGDAWRGNLLRDRKRVVLADWDTVSVGHREIDLIPTLQGPRFGLECAQRDAFIAAYGPDIRSWQGYPVLLDMRELSTLSAVLRNGHSDGAARRELAVRLLSLRTGDDSRWTSF